MDNHELRLGLGAQSMALLDAYDDDTIEAIGEYIEAIQKLIDRFDSTDLTTESIHGLVLSTTAGALIAWDRQRRDSGQDDK